MTTSAARIVGATQPACTDGERALDGLTTDPQQDGHNLSPCAAAFCDGDLSRYLDAYDLVLHSESEKPNHKKRAFPGWRGWFAGIFHSLRQAAQH